MSPLKSTTIMKTQIISGIGKRYLSEVAEFKQGLPFGVVNKKITDVGGTFAAVNCPHNYIIVVPFKDLANSIEADTNNKYDVFKVMGGVTKYQFNCYVAENGIKKIAVTYNSFKKLVQWLGEDIHSYKVLVDEYHLILEDLDFREDSINELLDNISKFKHYTFLSATPINTDFEFDFFKNLPHYEVEWDRTTTIRPFRMKTPNVYKATVGLIKAFEKGLELDAIDGKITKVKELHIFMNSVDGIARVCQTAGLKEEVVRIVCADTVRNQLITTNYSISSVTDPNAKVNFYTKKGFQGCNLFSNNGLIVVVSDAKKEHTLVDIETSLVQITGRLRTNDKFQNIFRHKIYHIYSTSTKVMSDEEFSDFMEHKKKVGGFLCSDLMSRDTEVREIYLERLNLKADLLSIRGNEVFLNLRKVQLFLYKHNLKKIYTNGLTIRDAYIDAERFVNTKQKFSSLDQIVLNKVTSITFKDLYASFLETDDLEPFELEYPEFFDYKKYVTVKEMNTLRWNKEKINILVRDKKILDLVHKDVASELKMEFVPSDKIKAVYKKMIAKRKLTLTAKASMIETNPFLKVKGNRVSMDGKTVRGYNLKFNFDCF